MANIPKRIGESRPYNRRIHVLYRKSTDMLQILAEMCPIHVSDFWLPEMRSNPFLAESPEGIGKYSPGFIFLNPILRCVCQVCGGREGTTGGGSVEQSIPHSHTLGSEASTTSLLFNLVLTALHTFAGFN